MAGSDAGKLNSPSRFQKSSLHLTLLEYSHCEVPAGCGGAVLRWIDPRCQVPYLLTTYSNAACDVRIDGCTVGQSHVTLRPGPHVLTFALERAESGEAAIAFTAMPDKIDSAALAQLPALKAPIVPVAVHSRPGPAWRAHTVAPVGDAWCQVGFDDSGWMAASPIPVQLAEGDSWVMERIRQCGAETIGLPGVQGPLWARHCFVVAGPR